MKPVPTKVRDAVDRLVRRFEECEYNPTPLIEIGALVVSADGTIEPEERDALRAILEPILGTDMDDELVGYLVDASASVIKSAGTAERLRFVSAILDDCDVVEQGVIVALAVAFASGRYSEPERKLIERLADEAELPKARLEALIAEVKSAYA